MSQPLSFMVPLTIAMATWMGCHAQTNDPAKAQASIDSSKASSWCGVLSPDAYNVLREQGTEPRFSGEFWLHDEDGVYVCMGCGAALFDSGAKFKSSSGWPSFFQKNQSNTPKKKSKKMSKKKIKKIEINHILKKNNSLK